MSVRPSTKREKDIEKLLSPEQQLAEDQDVDSSGKTTKARARSMYAKYGWIAWAFGVFFYLSHSYTATEFPWPGQPAPVPDYVKQGMEQCKIIVRSPPNPKPFNHRRTESDRFVPGTGDVLLRNATVWTGNDDGEEILREADVLLSGGVIKHVGKADKLDVALFKDAKVVELHSSWITPGIVDMHSHMGIDAAPAMKGTGEDTNSLKAPILPWLRSLDGLNTHDLAFNLSISGGITTMLVLPGSAGNIGGQAFTFKPRWTAANTPGSMQVDPPFTIHKDRNGTQHWERTGAWRHIKHACGENPMGVYGNNRMDSAYDFRRAYTEGKKLKEQQDRWCADPKSQKEPFPTSLEWEVLADVIRGNVKVNIHCYETTDLNSMVRISNEFEFPIAAFHHAHETYLVPDLLKQAWGSTPGVALFATNARYKREALRGSEYAPAILAREGIRVSMKSDHPVLDSRYLVYEAAQAHHYGLNTSHAIASVTSHSAEQVGLGHRLGYIRAGYDADVVVWDSFPLSLGATPKQVYIDGIAQIESPFVTEKPEEAQKVTEAGDWEEGAREAIVTRGEPDLTPKTAAQNVVFTNVKELYRNTLKGEPSILAELMPGSVVVVREGLVVCAGECVEAQEGDFERIDLKGGSLTRGMITVGSHVGNIEIAQEKTTWDGKAYDPIDDAAPLVDGILNHAVDGIAFGGVDELLAYRSGVTLMAPFPISSSLILGISCLANPSAIHSLAEGAVANPSAALHLSLEKSNREATSTRIGVLRRLLTADANNDTESWDVIRQVKRGERRVVVHVNKADTIAGLVRLKRDVGPGMKIAILGGAESWLVADDLAREDIGVIVAPSRSWPFDWESKRIIPGPPLSNLTLPAYLKSRGVLVGLGITEEWEARNTRADAAWVYANNPEVFTKAEAMDLVSKNLETLLGLHERASDDVSVEERAEETGWVAWEGDWATFGGRVRAVKGAGVREVHLF